MSPTRKTKNLPEGLAYYKCHKEWTSWHTLTAQKRTDRLADGHFFHNILDIKNIAVSVISSSKHPVKNIFKTDDRQKLQLNISQDLILLQIARHRKMPRLPLQQAFAMDLVLGNDPCEPTTLQPSAANDKPYSASKRNKKTFAYCSKCNIPICKEHTDVFCSVCGFKNDGFQVISNCFCLLH